MRYAHTLSRWLIAPIFLAASCAPGDRAGLTGSNSPMPPAVIVAPAGAVGAQADGDVRNGPIDIVRVEVTLDGREKVATMDARAGSEVASPVNSEVWFWVVWSAPGMEKPRLVVNWGAGEMDSPDNIHCGPCMLKHRYTSPGRRTLTVMMDDRVGGTTTRTFAINVFAETQAPRLSAEPCANYGGTRLQLNEHIVVCQNPQTWGAWDDALVGAGWNVCNERQWAAYAPPQSPNFYGLYALWINNRSCGSGSHPEIYMSYPMNDASCYLGGGCCWPNSDVLQFAVCNG